MINYVQIIYINIKSIINIIIIEETTFALNNKLNPFKNGYDVFKKCQNMIKIISSSISLLDKVNATTFASLLTCTSTLPLFNNKYT